MNRLNKHRGACGFTRMETVLVVLTIFLVGAVFHHLGLFDRGLPIAATA